MNSVLAVAAGGALGSVARYLLNGEVMRWFGMQFPLGILIVNVVGCFIMGVVAEGLALRFGASQELRSFLMTGVLGGFTTFSAFALDTSLLVERGQGGQALLYVILSVVGSILALFAGLWLVRTVLA